MLLYVKQWRLAEDKYLDQDEVLDILILLHQFHSPFFFFLAYFLSQEATSMGNNNLTPYFSVFWVLSTKRQHQQM